MISFKSTKRILFTLGSLILVTSFGLLGSKLEVLSSLQGQLLLDFACLAFQSKNNFTSCLGLFVENGLSLSTISHLLRVVTTLSLSEVRSLSSLVLSDLVHLVFTALLSGAESSSFLWYVNHFK